MHVNIVNGKVEIIRELISKNISLCFKKFSKIMFF